MPGDRKTTLKVTVGAARRQGPQFAQVLANTSKCSLGLRVAGDIDRGRNAAGDRLEAIGGDRERNGVFSRNLEELVGVCDVGIGPSPHEFSRFLGLTEGWGERVGE